VATDPAAGATGADAGAPVVVVGAGIAGSTLAAGLAARGIPAVVVERRSAGEPTGSAIALWPNALAALERIGRGAAVRAAGRAVPMGDVHRADGRPLQRTDAARARRTLGDDPLVIERGALLRALLAGTSAPGRGAGGHPDPRARRGDDRARAGGASAGAATRPSAVALRPGRGVVGLEPAVDGAEVLLAGGARLRARAVVGADGVGSVVAGTLGPLPVPRPAGYVGWRGVADLAVDSPAIQVWGDRAEAGMAPLPDGRTYWFATERTTVAATPGDPRAHVAALLRGWPAPLPALAAATPPDRLLRDPVLDRPLPRRWARGRAVLIGDAAHAMRPHLAQGGGQGIEDAVLLADVLAAAGGDPTAALERFARIRRRQVAPIALQARLLGTALHGGAPLGLGLHLATAGAPAPLALAGLARVASRAAFERRARAVLE